MTISFDTVIKPAKLQLVEQLAHLQQANPTVPTQVWFILTRTVQLTVELDERYLTYFWRLQSLNSGFARRELLERTTNLELLNFFQLELPRLVAENSSYLVEAAALWHELKSNMTVQLNRNSF